MRRTEMTLRQRCMSSSRLSEVNIQALKKEIGAIELHDLEDYFEYILTSGTKVSNTSNSIVAYLIGITDEKPKSSVIYEGGSLPDIDLDIPRHKRADLIEYLRGKYGHDKVANIGTYGFLYAKSAIRYAGKALGYEYDFVDSIAKLIPEPVQGVNWHIAEALEEVKELREMRDSNEDAAEVLKWASKIEGTLSNKSKHAAGIVIAADPIEEIASCWSDEGQSVIEFNMNEVESLGLTY